MSTSDLGHQRSPVGVISAMMADTIETDPRKPGMVASMRSWFRDSEAVHLLVVVALVLSLVVIGLSGVLVYALHVTGNSKDEISQLHTESTTQQDRIDGLEKRVDELEKRQLIPVR